MSSCNWNSEDQISRHTITLDDQQGVCLNDDLPVNYTLYIPHTSMIDLLAETLYVFAPWTQNGFVYCKACVLYSNPDIRIEDFCEILHSVQLKSGVLTKLVHESCLRFLYNSSLVYHHIVLCYTVAVTYRVEQGKWP